MSLAIDITKNVLALGATIGTGALVKNVIQHVTPNDLTTFQKVTTGIGAFAVGGMISSAAVKHMNAQVDEVVALFNQAKPEVEEVAETIKDDVVEVAENVKESVDDAAKTTKAAAKGVVKGVKDAKKDAESEDK